MAIAIDTSGGDHSNSTGNAITLDGGGGTLTIATNSYLLAFSPNVLCNFVDLYDNAGSTKLNSFTKIYQNTDAGKPPCQVWGLAWPNAGRTVSVRSGHSAGNATLTMISVTGFDPVVPYGLVTSDNPGGVGPYNEVGNFLYAKSMAIQGQWAAANGHDYTFTQNSGQTIDLNFDAFSDGGDMALVHLQLTNSGNNTLSYTPDANIANGLSIIVEIVDPNSVSASNAILMEY